MIRAFQWDLARQVERLDWLLAQLPRYAAWGYEELHLHLEDAVDYPSLPGVARTDAYSWSQFEHLVAAASQHGIRVVPIANLLGHTQYIIKTGAWRDLNELRAADGSPRPHGQISPSHPRTLDVAAKLIRDLQPHCTAGKIHVGLDESFHLGRHPAARAEIDRIGLATYFANYVGQLHQLAADHGLRTGIWADMLILLPEAIPQLPRGLMAYDWYYHGFRRHPRFELYNFAEYDLTPALRRQGVEYWGCPMNGAFRHEPLPVFGERLANARAWWHRCNETGAAGFLVTGWEPVRLALEMTMVVDAAIASLWMNPELDDSTAMLAKGFERTGVAAPAHDAARLALAGDTHAFAGYHRWEIDQRWSIAHPAENLAGLRAEARFFARAHRRVLPPAFAASVTWRLYLARRDVFVREAARGVMRARRLHSRGRTAPMFDLITTLQTAADAHAGEQREGRAAAIRMGRRTRRADIIHQNVVALRADQQRLRAWRRWLASVQKDPMRIWAASEVWGAWQVLVWVHNPRPCVQQVVLQQRTTNGAWRDLAQRHTIEFRSAAARPRSPGQRPWSVPIDDPTQPVRFVVRGAGLVELSRVQISNGVDTHQAVNLPARTRVCLGQPAPKSGWPDLAAHDDAPSWQPEWPPLPGREGKHRGTP